MIFKDQLGRTIKLDDFPKRIISLVPSQTELLCDLGLGERVIGITKFCVHPDKWFRSKYRVGGTKDLDLDKIRSLNPDLIIANKEENEQIQIDELAKDFPVWISDIDTVETAIDMIRSVGQMTGNENDANVIIHQIKPLLSDSEKPIGTAAYMIWNEPMMLAGTDTFISDMMKKAGFGNLAAGPRYPEFSESEMAKLNPDFILLSSEPFPFKESHQLDFQARFPNSKVMLVDGEMFSWYGSRMVKAASYLSTLVS